MTAAPTREVVTDVAQARGCEMRRSAILSIGRQELVINIRNKWTLTFAVAFGALVLAVSYVGIQSEGYSGLQNFTRTSASILNLVLYIVPLVALTMGTLSFTGDKGSIELLYSQPVSRGAVLVGKMVGLFISIVLSTLGGFSLAGFLIGMQAGTEGLFRYGLLVVFSLGLSMAFLSLAVLVAVASKRKAKSFGAALFLWFFFVLFYDLIVIGGIQLIGGAASNTFLFLSLLGNPVGMVRVASLIVLDNVTIFGAPGAALVRFFGGSLTSVAILTAVLAVWVVAPVMTAKSLLQKQDI